MEGVSWTKERAYMLELLNDYDKKSIREFLMHSELRLEKKEEILTSRVRRTLRILVDPYIYKKYHNLVPHFKKEIGDLLSEVKQMRMHAVKAAPDLQKFHILQNDIVAVITPWEEINKAQQDILLSLRMATKTIDYQNIGNSARAIMLKLSQIVFQTNSAPSIRS